MPNGLLNSSIAHTPTTTTCVLLRTGCLGPFPKSYLEISEKSRANTTFGKGTHKSFADGYNSRGLVPRSVNNPFNFSDDPTFLNNNK